MRPVVAIVSTRPETVPADYQRLFELAGFAGSEGLDAPIIAAEARSGGFAPGLSCPPWQLDAALKLMDDIHVEKTGLPLLVPVKSTGPSSNLRELHWDDILDRHNSEKMDSHILTPAPFRPGVLLPALEGVLPRGFQISPHMRGKNLLLLSTMGLGSGGVLEANVALLDSFLATNRKTDSKIPLAEVFAEIIGLAQHVFSSLAVVTDATVISVVRRGGARVPLVRNLLVAGTDPVAVDAVLLRLAGLDAADCPWLQLCQDRGLGVADLGGMSLVGETEWLDLDFRLPEDTFASGNLAAKWAPGEILKRIAGRQSGTTGPTPDSAWDRLFRDYQSGVTS